MYLTDGRSGQGTKRVEEQKETSAPGTNTGLVCGAPDGGAIHPLSEDAAQGSEVQERVFNWKQDC